MTEQTGQIARTRISREGLLVEDQDVWVTLKNLGQTSLADFSRWDVIVQYRGSDNNYYIKHIPYTAGAPGSNQWTVEGLFQDEQTSKSEVFDPNILNPSEEIKIHMRLEPMAKDLATNWAIIITSNGIAVPVIFIGQED